MKRYLLLFLLISTLACSNEKKNKFKLIPTGKTKNFILTPETKNFCFYARYFKAKNDSQYLVLSNERLNRIEFYNWNTGKLSNLIKLEKEGPNGIISGLRGLEVLSMDSILVFNSITYNGSFYLVDKNGKIIKKYEIKSTNPKYEFVPTRPNSMTNNSLYRKMIVFYIYLH
ncbi:MAG: DUF4221 family protein [Chloroflexia bacterium]|nr:DUF4221 family protein [Chloroflexia bacterium]